MLLFLHNGEKLDFLDEFDVVWIDPYPVSEMFANNLVQLTTLIKKNS